MKTSLTVLNSDAVNKYGYKFTIGALEGALWQTVPYGIPSSVSHDQHRLIGWICPFGLYFEPELTRIIGQFQIPENETDYKIIRDAYHNKTVKDQQDDKNEYDNEFFPLIENFLSKDYKFLSIGCASYIDKDIVSRVFPNLESLKKSDKDNLIQLKELLKDFNYHQQGVFFHKKSKLAIYSHEYFRRSLSRFNNFHSIFLDELISLKDDNDINIKIAIDFDMIGYSPSFFERHELEYWYGPSYNDDISTIKAGLTVYKHNELERLMSGISGLELEWKIQKHEHTLEIEEIRDTPTPTIFEHYGCRYIHSIYNSNEQFFQHFDGAIRMYGTELMLNRVSTTMTMFGRRSDYKKLFRVDGKLKLKNWKSLTTNYFQDNTLIYEYFGIEKMQIETTIENKNKDNLLELVPYSMKSGDSVRMLFSCYEKNDSLTLRSISSFDNVTLDGKQYDAIEYDIVELKKILKKQEKDIEIPSHVILIKCKDNYWNIPTIFHGGQNGNVEAYETLMAIKKIVNVFSNNNIEKIISYTISWNLEDREVKISMLGHVNDLKSWMEQCSELPNTREKLTSWLEGQAKYLKEHTKSQFDIPDIYNIVKYDGVLYTDRRNVNEDAHLELSVDDVGIKYKLDINGSKPFIKSLIQENKLFVNILYIYDSVKCLITKRDYIDSEFSVLFDEKAGKVVEKMRILGGFWSDHPSL